MLSVSPKPILKSPSPQLDIPFPESMDDIERRSVEIKRVLLYVVPSTHPKKKDSDDMRGTKGAMDSIKAIIRAVASIRDGEIDTIPEWYENHDGNLLYTISKNMARDTELKDMTDNNGFAGIIY